MTWKNNEVIPLIEKLIEEGNGRFTRERLYNELDQNDRRVRHALYEARKSGIVLIAVRKGGHAVDEYVFRGKKNGWKTREEYNLP